VNWELLVLLRVGRVLGVPQVLFGIWVSTVRRWLGPVNCPPREGRLADARGSVELALIW
jgi:hypothetical protein